MLRVGARIALGPFPTEDEFRAIKRAEVRRVVALLDDRHADDKPWVEQEESWAAAYGMRLHVVPMPAGAPARAQVRAALGHVQAASGRSRPRSPSGA